MLCTEIVSDIQKQFLYTTCSPHVLQKEELLTKNYLYLVVAMSNMKRALARFRAFFLFYRLGH